MQIMCLSSAFATCTVLHTADTRILHNCYGIAGQEISSLCQSTFNQDLQTMHNVCAQLSMTQFECLGMSA